MRFRTATWSSRSAAIPLWNGGTVVEMKRVNGPRPPRGGARTRLSDAEKKFFSECRFRAWNNVLIVIQVHTVHKRIQARWVDVPESAHGASRAACQQITPGCAQCNANFACTKCDGKKTLKGGQCVGLVTRV